MARRELLVVRHGAGHYGFPIERLAEVTLHPTLTPIPLAPPWVSGLLNLRGQVIVAIDLGLRLGAPRSTGAFGLLVRLQDDELRCALADEPGELVVVDDERSEPWSPKLSHLDPDLVTAVHQHVGSPVVTLDIDALTRLDAGPQAAPPLGGPP